MKSFTISTIMILSCSTCFAQSESNCNFAELKLNNEHDGGKILLEEWHHLAADSRSLALKEITQKVQAVGKDPQLVKFGSTDYVIRAAWFLAQVGTDEQIVSAFGSLAGFGNVEPDAAEALASCKSTAGVDIIEKLGKSRLSSLELAMNSNNDEEKARANDILIPFYFLVVRLEGATNPEGARAAKRLRDEVAARYPSENGRAFVAALDDEMAKVRKRIEKEKTSSEPLKPGNDSTQENVPEPTIENIQKTPAQTGKLKDTGVSTPSMVAAIFALVLAGATLIWWAFKNHGSR